MISAPAIAALALTAAVSYGLYEVKYEVQRLEQQYNDLSRELLKEQCAAHVLKAEWSYLSRPERVNKLARRFLKIRPTVSAQIVHLHDLPVRDLSDRTPGGGLDITVSASANRPTVIPAAGADLGP